MADAIPSPPADWIRDLILRAFEQAQTVPIAAGDRTNPRRSQNWLNALNDEFIEHYKLEGVTHIRSLCKACDDNKEEFGLNELLTDLCVVRVATVESHHWKKLLTYVASVLWQVESEFSSDGTEVVKDFNKLILGRAEHKLFVGPLSSGTVASINNVHSKFAEACSGKVYLALVPVPETWPTTAIPRVFSYERGPATWNEIR